MITAYAIPGIKDVPIPPAYDKQITVDLVERTVSDFFGVHISRLRIKKRTRNLVDCRYIIFHILKKHTKMSLKSIGEVYGRDHTTVIHGLQSFSDLVETDKHYKANVTLIEREVVNNAPPKLGRVLP